jgi:hypothetical protein
VSGDDITQILELCSSTEPEHAGESATRQLVNHAIAIGYTHDLHPAAAALKIGLLVASTLSADLPEADWVRTTARIASLLEQRAHDDGLEAA